MGIIKRGQNPTPELSEAERRAAELAGKVADAAAEADQLNSRLSDVQQERQRYEAEKSALLDQRAALIEAAAITGTNITADLAAIRTQLVELDHAAGDCAEMERHLVGQIHTAYDRQAQLQRAADEAEASALWETVQADAGELNTQFRRAELAWAELASKVERVRALKGSCPSVLTDAVADMKNSALLFADGTATLHLPVIGRRVF